MILSVESLKKSYLGKAVLNIESLHISKGEKVAITGVNGSGKSTFLNLVLDLIKPDEGNIFLFGGNVKGDEGWKFRTSAFINDSFLLDFLTVREYLYFIANNVTDNQITEIIVQLNFTSLSLSDYIKNLSSGNKKKVGILGALLTSSELILFDEVCNFLDYQSKKGLINYLGSLVDCTVVIVEHDLEFICAFANRILIFDSGFIVKDIEATNITSENIRNIA